MRPGLKLIGRSLLREALRKDGNPVDPNDFYQCYLYLWNHFDCAECGRELGFGYATAAMFPASEIPAAAEQAREAGWKLELPSEHVFTSMAHCPQCAWKAF